MFDRITVDPKQMSGAPCIRRLRIPVATLVGLVVEGKTAVEILADYPDVIAEDTHEALAFAAEAAHERQIPLLARCCAPIHGVPTL